MHSAALLIQAALLGWAGFGLLALCQERHFGSFYHSFKPIALWIRLQAAIGLIAISLALPLCIKAQGASFGSLLWVLITTLSAVTVALQLTWTPGLLRPLAWVSRHLMAWRAVEV